MGTIKVTIPRSWNELTSRQLQQLAVLFHNGKSGRAVDVQVFFILMNVRWYQFRKVINTFRITRNVPGSELRQFFLWVYKNNDRTEFIPEMKVKDEVLYSPMARLTNLSAEEFAVADDLYMLWLKTKGRKVLEYLAAVLYTTAPNLRPPYEHAELEAKAIRFTNVPLQELLAMRLAYGGCREYIETKYKRAFPKSGTPVSNGQQKSGFGEVILHMAGGKFGDHEKTRRTNLYTFLAEFDNNLKAKK